MPRFLLRKRREGRWDMWIEYKWGEEKVSKPDVAKKWKCVGKWEKSKVMDAKKLSNLSQ